MLEYIHNHPQEKEYYSGKKKSQVIVLPSGKDIVDVEAGKPGKQGFTHSVLY